MREFFTKHVTNELHPWRSSRIRKGKTGEDQGRPDDRVLKSAVLMARKKTNVKWQASGQETSSRISYAIYAVLAAQIPWLG